MSSSSCPACAESAIGFTSAQAYTPMLDVFARLKQQYPQEFQTGIATTIPKSKGQGGHTTLFDMSLMPGNRWIIQEQNLFVCPYGSAPTDRLPHIVDAAEAERLAAVYAGQHAAHYAANAEAVQKRCLQNTHVAFEGKGDSGTYLHALQQCNAGM